MSIADELSLVVGEVFEQQGSQVTIFTEMQEVLHVQGVDAVLRVVFDDLIRNEEWLVRVVGAETVHGETTGQASNGAEETFECFGHVVRDEVFVNLHHGDNALLRVGQ